MNNIKISNIIYDSYQEYEGECSLVLFLTGCNLACPHCYNFPYLNDELMTAKAAIDTYLRPNHTAVVFLGGEPTIWEELPNLVKYVKDKGLKTKIFTNGQNPKLLQKCGEYLDAISIDFKANSNVADIVGIDITSDEYTNNLFTSIYCMSLHVENIEIRTTKWPGVEYGKIGQLLKETWPEIPHIVQDYYIV